MRPVLALSAAFFAASLVGCREARIYSRPDRAYHSPRGLSETGLRLMFGPPDNEDRIDHESDFQMWDYAGCVVYVYKGEAGGCADVVE